MRFAASLLLATTAAATLAPPAAAQQGPCVFLEPNFQGQPFCFQAGEQVPNVGPQLNDRIRSVQVPPGLRVTLCGDGNFAGTCVTVTQSVPNTQSLGGAAGISSLSSEGGGRAGPPPDGSRRQQFGGPQQPPPGPPPRGPQYGAQQPSGPPPGMGDRGDRRREMFELRRACEDGDTRACVRFGIIIGENRERRAQWRRESPELFWWER